jgi:hypothetical protein
MAVKVPAALIKVRIPSSLKRFRFGAGGVEAMIDSNGKTLPIAAPAIGKTDKFLIASLRFMC